MCTCVWEKENVCECVGKTVRDNDVCQWNWKTGLKITGSVRKEREREREGKKRKKVDIFVELSQLCHKSTFQHPVRNTLKIISWNWQISYSLHSGKRKHPIHLRRGAKQEEKFIRHEENERKLQ